MPVLVALVEVVGAEILIHGSILQHVIDGREDGRSNGYDRLVDTAPRSDAVVQCLEHVRCRVIQSGDGGTERVLAIEQFQRRRLCWAVDFSMEGCAAALPP